MENVSGGGTAPARWRWRLGALALVGAFNLVTFNRYFPLSEGWWETYGYLYNAGLRPYRDFDLAFTPLFTLVNAGLLRVFGESFFGLRLFGVGVLLAAVLVLQLLLEQLFSPKVAAVAVTVSTFFAIASPQFIAKDYHSYQLGLVALSLWLHVRLAGDARLSARRRLGGTFLLGVAVALTFFLKQNVGALLLVAIAATLPVVERERPVARVVALGAGFAATFALMLPVVSLSDWRQLVLANDAKGSLATVLLRFWEPENRDVIAVGLALAAAWGLGRRVFAPPARWDGILTPSFRGAIGRPAVRWVAYLAVLVAVAASGHRIQVFLCGSRTSSGWMMPATLAFLALLAVTLVRSVLDRSREVDARRVAIALPLLALAYANTTTAVFDYIAMQVPVAIAMGAILAAAEAWMPPRHWALAALAFLVIVPEIVAAKLRLPYFWWGHFEGPVFAATAEPPYPQLRGMRVTPDHREVLLEIKDAVDTYSTSRTDVLFFSLPVFYWLHGKLPPYRTVVQWFDVVSSSQMEADLRELRVRPPRLVVALEPAEAAYIVHRRVRNTDHLPQEDFRALMDDWIATGKYRLVRSIPIAGETHRGVRITQDVLVQNAREVGIAPDAAVAGSGTIVWRAPVYPGDPPRPPPPGPSLRLGDVVTVHGPWERVRSVSETLGVARGLPRDWNTVNVYVRADADVTAEAGPAPRGR